MIFKYMIGLKKKHLKIINNSKFILRETENYIAYGNFENEKVEIKLKPTCHPKVRKMWKQLQKPIRRKKNGKVHRLSR